MVVGQQTILCSKISLNSSRKRTQTAEQGSYPEVMCATESGLEQRALYGPTGRLEVVGPVGKGTLNAHAYDKSVMARLWDESEKAVGIEWKL